jgi:hypothetical protein
MLTTHPRNPLQPREEVDRLLLQIRTLKLELDELQPHATAKPDVETKQRTLEQLRWRLADATRRTTGHDLASAA